jgi:hypothetical protein
MRMILIIATAIIVSGCLCCGSRQTEEPVTTTNSLKDQGHETPATVPPKTGKDSNPFAGMDCFSCDYVGDPMAKKDCQRHCKN